MKPYLVSGILKFVSGTTEKKLQDLGANTGNMVFTYAIDKILGSNIPSTPWHDPKPLGDIGVIPLANQFFPYEDKQEFIAPLKKLHTPLVAIGLGSQATLRKEIPFVPQGTINWVKTIGELAIEKHPNISLRGDFSYKVLKHYGLSDYCQVLGCPSLFISENPKLGKTLARKKVSKKSRIAVACGHEDWQEQKNIEKQLVKIINNSNNGSKYLMQSSTNIIYLATNEFDKISPFRLQRCKNYILPDSSDSEFITWIKEHAKVFFDIYEWFDWIKDFDFVVGMRIHACMVAISMGIPSLCIVHDSRTEELCNTMKIPYVLYNLLPSNFNLQDLIELYNFNPTAFDKNRGYLAKK